MRASAAPVLFDAPGGRVAWVDYAKGLCIILVVLFHTVNHYHEAFGQTGWMQAIVDVSKPFRMPDFFLISGLFLSRTIDAPLRTYIDRKMVHFLYFYLLWLAFTQLATDLDTLAANPAEFARLYVWNIVQPVGTLWFVHMLAIFYAITRLIRRWPKWLVLAIAAGLQIAHQALWIDTPSFAANRAMDYFFFFFLGYAAADLVFGMADLVRKQPMRTAWLLAAWFACNVVMALQGLHFKPVYGLLMGLAGALAVVQISVLLSRFRIAGFLRYCGRNSIVIYLSFFFPMMALIRLFERFPLIPDAGWACAFILVVCVAGPLAFHRLIRRTPLVALYERPRFARLVRPKLSASAYPA